MGLDLTLMVLKEGTLSFYFCTAMLDLSRNGIIDGRREVELEDDDYATCKQCLRVYRPIEMVIPEGIITMWGIYFDPYLEDSLAGQFMKSIGVKNLPYSKKEQINAKT